MKIKSEIKETPLWQLYDKGVNYNRTVNLYETTDKCFRFYNGDQWNGLKSGGIEPVSYPIIEPIVNYKVGTINQNEWAIHYSSDNFDDIDNREIFKEACDLLNKRVSRVWEKDSMDYKIRRVSNDSAIIGEGIVYVDYDEESDNPINEVLNNTDICYGNENCSDIQGQPYIIIKTRRPVEQVRNLAADKGVKEEDLLLIQGDQQVHEEAGDASKQEVNNMCTVVTKMYKENGTVHFERATRYVTIQEDTDSGLSLYPLAHMIWKEVKGYARGVGEVKYLIPNQIEINKTLMRRVLIVKLCAYPKNIILADKIQNPQDADKVGVTLKVNGTTVDDVRKAFASTTPASMSNDANLLQEEMISKTRELKNASELATGNVNPEDASGKAILAVQQASNLPLNEHILALKTCVEDLGRIYLDMWTVYAEKGLNVVAEKKEKDETVESVVNIAAEVLRQLKATVKVDITPKSSYDKLAVEQSLENLLLKNYISFDEYVDALPYDSTMPKQTLQDILKSRKQKEAQIQQQKLQAQSMINSANKAMNIVDQMNEVQTAGM
jgi:hypothetical protein